MTRHIVPLLAALAVGCATRGPPMHDFALLFCSTRSLTAQELRTRNAAAREWALARQREGVLQHAAPLEPEGQLVSAAGVVRAEPHVASVLILRAPDLNAATALAQAHPGLAYGTEIEVRPLKPVQR